MHRPIEGEIKTCTLKKTPSGAWDITFSSEVKAIPLEPKAQAIGIDVGIASFATFSNGDKIKNPRFFKKGEKALAKAQRKLSRLEKGTKERRKAGKAASKIHERIKNQRKDFCHKEAKKIIDQYQYICLEDLDIKNMIERSHFAKSIIDVSWNQFRQFLTYKAAEAGRKLELVNPAYTSQICSQCKHLEPKKLAERKHKCSKCGYTADRDVNAAQNILALGLDGLGITPRSLRL
jgi:putative transposase